MKNRKLITGTLFLCLALKAVAFDYMPKDINSNPFADKVKNNQKTEQAIKPEMREIKNLAEYFKYLPAEVHRHWIPYKSNAGYEVTVQFRVHRDGTISDTEIVKSTNPDANTSVLNAVKTGAPYQPLPQSYPNKNGVLAQIVLEYRK